MEKEQAALLLAVSTRKNTALELEKLPGLFLKEVVYKYTVEMAELEGENNGQVSLCREISSQWSCDKSRKFGVY